MCLPGLTFSHLPLRPPRVFASLHLLALYLAMCGQLPGLEALQRPELERLLRLIGIWNPTIHRCGVPAVAFVLAP